MFAFNFQHWQTRGLEPVVLEPGTVTESTGVLEPVSTYAPTGATANSKYSSYSYITDNLEASSIQIKIHQTSIGIEKTLVCLDVLDSGMSSGFYRLDDLIYSSGTTTATEKIQVYGYLKQINISAQDSLGRVAQIDEVILNCTVPFNFQYKRVLLLIVAFAFLYLFRPKSQLWNIRHSKNPKYALMVSVAAVLVLVPFYNFGLHNLGYDVNQQTWGTSLSGALDEYSELAKQIVNKGQFDIEVPDNSEWLSQMDGLISGDERLLNNKNVYDPSARTTLVREEGYSGYKVDISFFNGKCYVYFGVVPCLVAYIPYYLITGADLPNTFATIPALIVFAIFSYLILDLLVKRKITHASSASLVLSFIAVMLASCIVYIIALPWFYLVPIIYAMAFLTAGAYLLGRAYFSTKFKYKILLAIAGSFLLALTLGCRPQIAIAAIIVGVAYLIFEARQWQLSNKKRKSISRIASTFICCIAPALIVVAGLMWYNFARFGSPLDFGANYNLTGNDMTLRGHSLGRAIESLFYYLFSTPEFISAFPYINLQGIPQLGTAILTISETLVSGILYMAPFMILALVELFNKQQKPLVRRFIFIAFAFALFIAAFDGEAASITYRYLCDFGFAVGFGCAVAMLSISKSAVSEQHELKRANVSHHIKPIQADRGNLENRLNTKKPCKTQVLNNAMLKGPNKIERIYFMLICLTMCYNLIIWISFDYMSIGSKLAEMQQVFDVLGPVIR